VGGGEENTASGDYASVSGGARDTSRLKTDHPRSRS
jgi:hypothetical protein